MLILLLYSPESINVVTKKHSEPFQEGAFSILVLLY